MTTAADLPRGTWTLDAPAAPVVSATLVVSRRGEAVLAIDERHGDAARRLHLTGTLSAAEDEENADAPYRLTLLLGREPAAPTFPTVISGTWLGGPTLDLWIAGALWRFAR